VKLKDRVALVTGGARGIGAAVCAAYAREGAAVVINYHRRQELAEQVANEIQTAGGRAIAVQGDVSQADDVRAMVETAHDAFGSIDILVANAAIYPRGHWHLIAEDEWDRVMAVNLKGAFLCAQAVYADMQRKHYGKIITVGSVVAELGWGPFLHYVTTKSGLVGFTRSLAREVGPKGIRVNCVMPGAIQTEQELADFPDQAELATFLAERQCLPQRGRPDDMVGAFVYLASHDSDFMTGQVMTVDGGWVHY
jgi:3-oxoacyl-[acyl-carrier protein] reductase